jgi:hypothetical protein
VKTVAKLRRVLRSTLQRYVKGTSPIPKEGVPTALGRKTVLPRETEDGVSSYCIDMDGRYCRVSTADVRRLAYHLVIRNDYHIHFHTTELKPKTNS